MKTLRNLFTISLVLVSFISFAQTTSVDGTLNSSATVLSNLSFAQGSALSFGNVPATNDQVIVNPNGNTNASTGATVGRMDLNAAANTAVTFSFPTSLTLTDGSNPLTVNLAVYGATETSPSSYGTALTSGDVKTTDASGNYYLFVGGTLPALTNQATGTYSGTATFTVAYN